MKTKLLLLLTFVLAPCIFGQNLSKVGMTARAFADEGRQNWTKTGPRPISTIVWYPAAAAAKEESVVIGNPENPLFLSGSAARDAEFPPSGKRLPLIVVSHGTGGSALQMMWLGQYLAARGYIVAAVNHHGNTGAEDKYRAQGFVLWWERARDLQIVIDRLLADERFGRRIDAGRIGAAGFSLGGATVTALAGGIFDFATFEKFCASAERDATCDAQPEYPDALKEFENLRKTDAQTIESLKRAEVSYRDRRVKAIFALAPALGAAFTPASLKAVKIPALFLVGEADAVTPAAANAQRLARSIAKSEFTILPGRIAHYTFLSECTAFGQKILPICRDADGVDRVAAHRNTAQTAARFFERHLR